MPATSTCLVVSRYGGRVDGYVFISYRHGIDGSYVLQLADFLTNSGISAWHDSEVVTGDRWERVIKDKIEGCSAFVVIMTPDSEQSDWVNREITHAERMHRPILPLLLRQSASSA